MVGVMGSIMWESSRRRRRNGGGQFESHAFSLSGIYRSTLAFNWISNSAPPLLRAKKKSAIKCATSHGASRMPLSYCCGSESRQRERHVHMDLKVDCGKVVRWDIGEEPWWWLAFRLESVPGDRRTYEYVLIGSTEISVHVRVAGIIPYTQALTSQDTHPRTWCLYSFAGGWDH